MAIEEVDDPDFDSHVAHATRQTDRLVSGPVRLFYCQARPGIFLLFEYGTCYQRDIH